MHYEQSLMREAKHYIREYIKTNPSDEEKFIAWDKLAELCQSTNDWDGESHALSEICLLPSISINTISDVANRVNGYYFQCEQTKVDVEIKELLMRKIADIFSANIAQTGTASDYSRLAWLNLNLKNSEKAIQYVNDGLNIDPENIYCLRLAKKLDMQ